MENQYLNGVGNGMPRTKLQAMFVSFTNSPEAANILNADIQKMLKAGSFKFYRKNYFLGNAVSGGSGSATDLLATLQNNEKVGLCNINNKKIEDNRAALVDRLELMYSSSTATGTAADVIPTLSWSPITDAPEAIVNGEFEFSVKDNQIGKFLVSDFCEPIEGTQTAKPYGFALRAAQLLQSNETIGGKIYTAGDLDATGGLKHYVKMVICCEGVKIK